MKRSVLVICVSAGLCLLLFPTTGAPATQSATTEDLELSQTAAHNGAYTSYTDDGRLRLAIGTDERGLNDEAVTTIDHIFELTYTGPDSATVWLEVPSADGYFYRGSDPGQPIKSEATGIRLASGEGVRLGLLLDTRGVDSNIGQFDTFRLMISAPGTDGEDDTEQIPVDPTQPSDDGGSDGTAPEERPDGPDEPDENTPADTGGDRGDGDDGEPPIPTPPIDIPNIPVPDVDLGTGDGAGSGDNSTGATGDGGESVIEPGTAPETGQTTLGSVRWILLLLSGLIFGTMVAAGMRRLITRERS